MWARPGLDRETRRLVAIAMLVALGRHEELEMHMRAGIADGLSTTELREVLLQTAVYAGVPAANSAFALANRVWAEVSAGRGQGWAERRSGLEPMALRPSGPIGDRVRPRWAEC